MDFKESFKPTIVKIIIFIIIFIVFVPFIEPHGYQCIRAPCPQPITQSLLTQFLFLQTPIVGIYYTNLIVGLIVSYLLSGLIVFWINKTRKYSEKHK